MTISEKMLHHSLRKENAFSALYSAFSFLLFYFFFVATSGAQCPPFPLIALTTMNDKITFDDFAEITGGVSTNALYIDVDADCAWDLYVDDAVITQVSPYSTQAGSVSLPLSNINIRAVNPCLTADQDYGAGSPPCTPDPTRICSSYGNPLVAGGDNYIIGTPPPAIPDGVLAQNPATCPININDAGDVNSDPHSHRIRIDLQVIPGIAPVIQPGFYTLDLTLSIIDDDRNGAAFSAVYTLQIDIQPILQLKMNTSSQIDFLFSDIKQYNAGIVQYGTTILSVSSSVGWDLMAVGTSTRNESTLGGSPFWDNAAAYSTTGSADIRLDVLELHQIPTNPSAGADYSAAFTNPPSGSNNIEVGFQSGVIPSFVIPLIPLNVGDKTIAGNWELGVGGTFMAPGTHTPDLVPPLAEWDNANFRYVIDYKITPGLPVTFPDAVTGDRVIPYAQSGSYTMQVRYMLYEDQ